MRIGGLQTSSPSAFPGKVALVVFCQGCNLRCPYCNDSSLVVPNCFGPPISKEDVLEAIDRRRDRIDAVVVSGGEPTVQGDLAAFLRDLRATGLALKLDTNGTRPDVLHALLRDDLVDFVAMDLKAPLTAYAQAVGRPVRAEWIRRSVWLLRNSGVEHEFRTTAVPGMHTVRELKLIVEMINGADCYAIQEFVSRSPLQRGLAGRPAFPRRTIEDLRPYMERRVKRFVVRTCDEAVQMPTGKRRRAPQPLARNDFSIRA